MTGTTIGPAESSEYDQIRRLTCEVYREGGFGSPEYQAQLADVEGRAAHAVLLVAREDDRMIGGDGGRVIGGDGGRVIGSVALVLDGTFGEVTQDSSEAAFRMLVVDPTVRGAGIGELLVRTCLDRARSAGKRTVVLSTEPTMHSAHRLYERLGFRRLPERDWTPLPGTDLLVYALEL